MYRQISDYFETIFQNFNVAFGKDATVKTVHGRSLQKSNRSSQGIQCNAFDCLVNDIVIAKLHLYDFSMQGSCI